MIQILGSEALALKSVRAMAARLYVLGLLKAADLQAARLRGVRSAVFTQLAGLLGPVGDMRRHLRSHEIQALLNELEFCGVVVDSGDGRDIDLHLAMRDSALLDVAQPDFGARRVAY